MASVFCYVPNLIGYFRLTMIFTCWLYFDDYRVLLPLYTFQMLLDGIDGCVARRMNQCSAFGAWVGVFVSCLEWTVFVCTHSMGPQWKDSDIQMPVLVAAVMSNGFYNLVGGYVIAGLHGLPLVLYIYQHVEQISYMLNYYNYILALVLVLIPARLIGSYAELWFIHVHIAGLIQDKHHNDHIVCTEENTEETE